MMLDLNLKRDSVMDRKQSELGSPTSSAAFSSASGQCASLSSCQKVLRQLRTTVAKKMESVPIVLLDGLTRDTPDISQKGIKMS